MSLKNSYVTSDYIEWDTMLSLVRKLYRDKEYRMSLLIGCGSFFGLRTMHTRMKSPIKKSLKTYLLMQFLMRWVMVVAMVSTVVTN